MKPTTVVLLASAILLLGSYGSSHAQTMVLDDAYAPWWSPDGAMLACHRPSAIHDVWHIWSVDVTGTNPQPLIEDPNSAYLPTWLPDGRHIFYCRLVNGGLDREFVVYDLDGGPPVVMSAPELWDDPGFNLSPDGSEVLYTTSHSPYETWAFNLSDGSTRHVADGLGGAISPDGQWIAFVTDEDSIAVVPAGGGQAQFFELGWWPRWTADSQYIVFAGMGTSGNRDLIAISRDGSFRQQLTDDPQIEWSPVVSTQGDRVAYGRSTGEFEPSSIWVLDLGFGSNEIEATLDFDPGTLNLKSKGKYLTCYVELPEGYDPWDIDLGTVMLNDVVAVEARPTSVGDYDGDTIPDLMVKFNRDAVISLLSDSDGSSMRLSGREGDTAPLDHGDEFDVTVSGYLVDGRMFSGTDVIRVINPGGGSDNATFRKVCPSPLNATASISYQVPQEGHVSLRVYDVAGRLVRTLVSGHKTAGRHEIKWDRKADDGQPVATGVYFLRLEQRGEASVEKALVVN